MDMAQAARSGRFDTIFNDGRLEVHKNHTNDIFVVDLVTGVSMRISQHHHTRGGLEFTTDGRVEPIQVTNMIGWLVSRRS